MAIFLACFVPGQGALPASRRVFHAPLIGHKTGDTDSERHRFYGLRRQRCFWLYCTLRREAAQVRKDRMTPVSCLHGGRRKWPSSECAPSASRTSTPTTPRHVQGRNAPQEAVVREPSALKCRIRRNLQINQHVMWSSQGKSGLTGWEGSVRARFKDWRPGRARALSAHPFLGAQDNHSGARAYNYVRKNNELAGAMSP